MSAKASLSQLSSSGNGSVGRSSGSAGLLSSRPRPGAETRWSRARAGPASPGADRTRRAAISPKKAQTDPDPLFQELEYPYEARLAGGGEATAGETADPDRLRAERDRLDDVGAAHERAVDDDRRAPVHGRHHLGEHVGAAAPVIELSA